MADSETLSVAEWFRGRNIFVTGGTGFMGKVLIYKLLLSCHDLGNVFVLVRKKKEVDPHTRLQHMIQQEPFKVIKEKYPERLKKIILVPGETTTKDLALSTADKERLLREVSVVFHMAANVKFDLSLKEAVRINTLGTMNVLNLVKQIADLGAFIHVSTAFCQCTEPVLEERAYPTTIRPEVVIDTVNNLTDEVIAAMTPKMLDGQPNTYAFSKSLSEELVQKCGLPAGVARPSIVIASMKEPVSGWVENMNGPTGLMVGAGKGVIRTVLCNYDYLLNVIPCDMAINAVIALAWKVGIEKPPKPIFMNVTNGTENPLSWGSAVNTGKKHATTYPFTGVLWYPGGSATTSKFYHWIRVIFFHFLPAYVLDALIALTGNKPFLVRVQHKVNAGIELIQYYTTKQWDFRNDRMKKLQLELNESDREEFFMDTSSISWDDYMLRYVLGIRQYCLKDDPSTIPRAQKVLRYLYFADWFVKISLTLFFMWFIYSWISPIRELAATPFDVHEI
ncbi:PREDICTED: putative fatty acyl-CoA reductase CG5065 [Dufourea novaeangliae]|uniref:putative fatty acyl-CoA reductase CG5065 n=1 Tax=Dufourea novaeangliae TaxID=178035 RepID=UPI000766E64A|nr:PREDICTED: putative fatty acyl-CoA reductase CG5065 [Dufourea novaeangliae]